MPVTFLHGIALGTLPDWLGGVGTVGTLVYVAAQAQRDRRRARAERQQRLDESRDREVAQARLIAISTGWSYSSMYGHEAAGEVVNHSAAPIFDVRVLLEDHMTVLTADDSPQELQTEAGTGALGPGERFRYTLYPSRKLAAPKGGTDAAAYQALGKTFSPRVEYTDAAGLRWYRIGNDLPQRMIQ